MNRRNGAPGAPRVLLITDPFFGDERIVRSICQIATALPRGAFGVQLRDKTRAAVSLRMFASRLRLATLALGVPFWVNGRVQIARDVGADGVHLGAQAGTVPSARAIFGRPACISVAVHSDEDVRRASGEGADAVLVSPVLPTRALAWGAPEKAPRGFSALERARKIADRHVLVYALGGITGATAKRCAASGADGVALIRGLLGDTDPGCAARAIHDAFACRW